MNDLNLDDIEGTPRLIDFGQCNDLIKEQGNEPENFL